MDNYTRFCQDVMDELFNCQREQFHAHPPRLSDYIIQETHCTYQQLIDMNYKHCYFSAKEYGDVHAIPSLKLEIIKKMQEILTDPLYAYEKKFVVACKFILNNLSSIVYEKNGVDLKFVHKERIFASHFVSPPHDEELYRPSVFDELKENTLNLSTVLFIDFVNKHFGHLIGQTIYGFRTDTAEKEALFERIGYSLYDYLCKKCGLDRILNVIRKQGREGITCEEYERFVHRIELT